MLCLPAKARGGTGFFAKAARRTRAAQATGSRNTLQGTRTGREEGEVVPRGEGWAGQSEERERVDAVEDFGQRDRRHAGNAEVAVGQVRRRQSRDEERGGRRRRWHAVHDGLCDAQDGGAEREAVYDAEVDGYVDARHRRRARDSERDEGELAGAQAGVARKRGGASRNEDERPADRRLPQVAPHAAEPRPVDVEEVHEVVRKMERDHGQEGRAPRCVEHREAHAVCGRQRAGTRFLRSGVGGRGRHDGNGFVPQA